MRSLGAVLLYFNVIPIFLSFEVSHFFEKLFFPNHGS